MPREGTSDPPSSNTRPCRVTLVAEFRIDNSVRSYQQKEMRYTFQEIG